MKQRAKGKLKIVLRLMGESSQPEVVMACARAADSSPLDELWVPDHIAIPPDDAEGSGVEPGRRAGLLRLSSPYPVSRL